MRAMLGSGGSGAAAGINATLIDTHLRNAQTLLYATHDWVHMRAYDTSQSLGLHQYLLDYPTDSNPDRIRCDQRLPRRRVEQADREGHLALDVHLPAELLVAAALGAAHSDGILAGGRSGVPAARVLHQARSPPSSSTWIAHRSTTA
jgi:hypothetical protein